MISADDFERVLKELVGLDVESIGASAIERAVKERQSASRLDDLDAYWQRLQTSDAERQSLVEAVVVPETWFFRDGGAFDGLRKITRNRAASGEPDSIFRILSVPCSTGEEAYSIAMTLREAGLRPGQYHIDAIDISHNALAKARKSVYGENSFRGNDLGFRDQYFSRVANGYQLADAVRDHVCFEQGNLLSPTFLSAVEPYDVIFCRNLFIYFDRGTQQRAIAVLTRLLAPDGVLFVGSSETGAFAADADGLAAANLRKAFAFQRSSGTQRSGAPRPVVGRRTKTPQPLATRTTRLASLADRPAPARTSARPATAQRRPSIEEAYRLADQGHFAEAAKLCDEHVRREARQRARSTCWDSCVMQVVMNPMPSRSIGRRCTSIRATAKRSCTLRCCWNGRATRLVRRSFETEYGAWSS